MPPKRNLKKRDPSEQPTYQTSRADNLYYAQQSSENPNDSEDERSVMRLDDSSVVAADIPFIHEPVSEDEEEIQKIRRISDLLDHESYPFIMTEKNLVIRNKNTPRFLVRTAVKYIPRKRDLFGEIPTDQILEECERLEEWHLQDKGHVYLINHLRRIFSKESRFHQEVTRRARRVFHRILRDHSIDMLKEPKNQIKSNRIDYLRSAKIFSLRCKNEQLVTRNQCQ